MSEPEDDEDNNECIIAPFEEDYSDEYEPDAYEDGYEEST